jgi:hypothetical protein
MFWVDNVELLYLGMVANESFIQMEVMHVYVHAHG